MVVVVRQADQRHALGKTKLACEQLRRPGHLLEAAALEAGGFGGTQQFQALRHFLEHRTRQRARQCRIIPTGKPGVDVADVAAEAAQG